MTRLFKAHQQYRPAGWGVAASIMAENLTTVALCSPNGELEPIFSP